MRIKQVLLASPIQGSGLSVFTHYVEPKNSPHPYQYKQHKQNQNQWRISYLMHLLLFGLTEYQIH